MVEVVKVVEMVAARVPVGEIPSQVWRGALSVAAVSEADAVEDAIVARAAA